MAKSKEKSPPEIDWESPEGMALKKKKGYSPHAEDKFTADEDEFDIFDEDGNQL